MTTLLPKHLVYSSRWRHQQDIPKSAEPVRARERVPQKRIRWPLMPPEQSGCFRQNSHVSAVEIRALHREKVVNIARQWAHIAVKAMYGVCKSMAHLVRIPKLNKPNPDTWIPRVGVVVTPWICRHHCAQKGLIGLLHYSCCTAVTNIWPGKESSTQNQNRIYTVWLPAVNKYAHRYCWTKGKRTTTTTKNTPWNSLSFIFPSKRRSECEWRQKEHTYLSPRRTMVWSTRHNPWILIMSPFELFWIAAFKILPSVAAVLPQVTCTSALSVGRTHAKIMHSTLIQEKITMIRASQGQRIVPQ